MSEPKTVWPYWVKWTCGGGGETGQSCKSEDEAMKLARKTVHYFLRRRGQFRNLDAERGFLSVLVYKVADHGSFRVCARYRVSMDREWC